ncbi:flagellar hook-associated protein 1 FlgK [Peptoclostridium litorale DSM 5388]|uniref:Flagellar hook-associated protein 1 n=1 Tax=Peptoclostridium litorale DSM 5388 TaxID=1121324 RepID=A0A069RCK7_PEPLI|nr:flagellar hook-associated protein FlgK [Peptoclostridium litorale]KDR94756.1 flagellar hook-associated protein 1 [Peptoclostridium litorale DSM 5388]SIN92001.1 flagellar hook-associated protein 1 FlgK [Peptoclostridium litorale DSM 5388]
MRSTFFGFNIAKSGLFSAQRALDITGHNIANAETPGYSRQRLEQVQETPMKLPSGILGTGVTTTSISQIRNEFLDGKFRYENTVYGESSFRYQSLSEIEAIMNEPSESGIRSVMDDYFSSLQELSKDPSSLTTRALVRERANSLSYSVNHMYNQFEKMVRDSDFAVRTTVDQINTYASDIADLNEQIFRAEIGGHKANDLRDRRNLLIDELSNLVGVEVKEVSVGAGSDGFESKKVNILINGTAIVSHDKVVKIEADENMEHPEGFEELNVKKLKFSTGEPFNTDAISGKLKAQIDMRDNGEGSVEKGIPYYMQKLDEFVATFAAETNMVHRAGYGLNQMAETAPGEGHGINFFEAEGAGYTVEKLASSPIQADIDKGMSEKEAIKKWEEGNEGYTLFKDSSGDMYKVTKVSAKSLKLSQAIQDDLDNMAVAGKSDEGTPPKGLAGDNSNILSMSELRNKTEMFAWGSPDDFVKSLVSNLGVDAQDAKRVATNQEVLTSEIGRQKMSVSGVSLDEEMSNMVRFQHSYNAAARMLTTVDEMIDVIINRMGRVGL